jgi:hypothetical protein
LTVDCDIELVEALSVIEAVEKIKLNKIALTVG